MDMFNLSIAGTVFQVKTHDTELWMVMDRLRSLLVAVSQDRMVGF